MSKVTGPLKKFNNIVKGWANYAVKDELVEELARVRAKICSTCPYAQKKKYLALVVGEKAIKEIKGLVCAKCMCPLSGKLRVIEETCPHPDGEKW